MAVNGIEIQMGQTWRTRGGREVRIIDFDEDDLGSVTPYPWLTDRQIWVNADGQMLSYQTHEHDLVQLVSGAPDAPEADAGTLAIEMLTDLGWVFTDGVWVQDGPPAYASLADVLNRALQQASQGKGKERHASGDTPFEEQPMATINKQIGSVHGFIFQAHKKSLEALRLPAGRDTAELLGAINYLAGAVIALESWARKTGV